MHASCCTLILLVGTVWWKEDSFYIHMDKYYYICCAKKSLIFVVNYQCQYVQKYVKRDGAEKGTEFSANIKQSSSVLLKI